MTSKRSPDDEATYIKWHRGMCILYVCIGLMVVGVVLATHFSRVGLELAVD
jgi:hypothetical protein